MRIHCLVVYVEYIEQNETKGFADSAFEQIPVADVVNSGIPLVPLKSYPYRRAVIIAENSRKLHA